MAITIESVKTMEFQKANGWQFEEDITPAFDTDRRMSGVVLSNGNFKATFPLNGHRARNLAEAVLGQRDASLWTIGKTMVVQVEDLEALPNFDQKYYDILNGMKVCGAMVTVITVCIIDPGYGCFIRLASGIPNSVV